MFNWFRRNNKAKQETPKAAPEHEPQKQEEVVAESETKTPSQEDYLALAKAAYKNIQAKKEQAKVEEVAEEVESTEEAIAETPEPTLEPESTTEPEAATEPETTIEVVEEEIEAKSETVNEVVEPVTVTPATDQVVEAESAPKPADTPTPEPATIESEAVTDSVTTPETKLTEEIEETTPEAPEPVETPTNVPAWMQKSQGLEKLQETAIAEPEPEPELDDDFVWSAGVLARQGRTAEEISEEEISWLTKLRQGVGKTRRGWIVQLKSLVGQGPLNKDAIEEIEFLLLQADIGIDATDYIVETLQDKLKEEALPPEEAIAYLKTILQDILDKPLQGQDNKDFVPEDDILNIWLLTGVNGAGKTTTIGKLTNLAKGSGYNCLIAAADTFRAAAVQQVQVWGERTKTEVIANPGQNTDPAAVVYDAISAAKSRDTNLLLVDTAGRLQNKKNLMDELAKIRRVVDKNAPDAKIESLLVIDSTLGQNSLYQAKVFSEAAQLSGVVLTKLDGSAKGGVALAIARELNLPIRFVGVGEGIEDLRPFSSYEFVEALLEG